MVIEFLIVNYCYFHHTHTHIYIANEEQLTVSYMKGIVSPFFHDETRAYYKNTSEANKMNISISREFDFEKYKILSYFITSLYAVVQLALSPW